MKRKFKVGDRVKTRIGSTGKIIYVSKSSDSKYPYLLIFDDETSGSWAEGSLTLIPISIAPDEPKYKSGDKVWNKDTKSAWEFSCYQDDDQVTIKKTNTLNFLTTAISDIEPYTGQDKKEE